MNEDAQLLGQFARTGDEAAFRELVERYFALVYSAALRQVNGDAHLAEDVAQSVFTDLARKAGSLSRRVVLAGWVYEAARFAASKAVRAERRRERREKEASAMQDPAVESNPEWEELCPVLDAAMGDLRAKDRNAVLMRFFEAKSFRAVGAGLGVSEDAAQKRVARALELLRSGLAQRGVTTSTAGLSLMLMTSGVQLPPAGLVASVAAASLKASAAVPHLSLASSFLQALATTKTKLALTMAGAVLLGSGVAAALYLAPPDKTRFVSADLTSHYNGELDKCWLPGWDPANNLASFPHGQHVFRRVPFDVGGVVQLQGREWLAHGYQFPERVEAIAVGSLCSRLHVLHANSAIGEPPGMKVAGLVLHYSDGQQAEIPIRQGEQVLDWWAWPAGPDRLSDPGTVVAWTGKNPVTASKGFKIRICKSAFANPNPKKKVETIDYVSAMTGSAPFMLALTVER